MRISACSSSVTSWRRETAVTLEPMSGHLRFLGFLDLGPRGQLVARAPQGREEVVMDHLAEQLDRRSMRPDDLVADDAGDDLVVADAPHRHALVPLDQRFGELLQILVVASLHVDLDEVEAGGRDRVLECLAERWCGAAHVAKAR